MPPHARKDFAAGDRKERTVIPWCLGNEVVHRLVEDADPPGIDPRSHGFDALALAFEAQPRQVRSKRRMPIPMATDGAQSIEVLTKTGLSLVASLLVAGHGQTRGGKAKYFMTQ